MDQVYIRAGMQARIPCFFVTADQPQRADYRHSRHVRSHHAEIHPRGQLHAHCASVTYCLSRLSLGFSLAFEKGSGQENSYTAYTSSVVEPRLLVRFARAPSMQISAYR